MELDNITENEATDSRQDALLDAAIGVFARYGFRKTTMDEVARAAGVSRQGLYLHFADKEALFRKAVAFKLNHQLRAATRALTNEDHALEHRLIAACDEWSGRFVGIMGADAADLMCASTTLAGTTLSDYEERFETALANAIRMSPLADYCAASGISPADVACALHATARGLKHSCESRQEFIRGMTVAAHMFCAPLGLGASQGVVHADDESL